MTAPPIHWRYPRTTAPSSGVGEGAMGPDSGQFCHSSIADKMSDYEDIWNDTMTKSDTTVAPAAAALDISRSMTPSVHESETQLKTYLASKLMGGGGQSSAAASVADDSTSSFCSVAFNNQQSSSISNSSSNSLASGKSSYISSSSSTVTSVTSQSSSASSSVPMNVSN